MAIQKVERLMNLVICLLSTKQYVSAEQIHRSVAGYQDSRSDEAFSRMLERDKSELRDLGIPLETGISAFSDVEGYRIRRDAYALGPIDLDRSESAAVAMAAAVWSSPEMSAAAQSALMKLRSAGIAIDTDPEVGAALPAPGTAAPESVLHALFAAIESGRPVRFEHRSGVTTSTRTLEAWGVVTNDRRWYVVGHDRDRDAMRTFRLSRIVGEIHVFGKPGEVVVPKGTDLQAIVATAIAVTEGDSRVAHVWVAEGRAAGLRRLARSSTPLEQGGDDGDVLEFELTSVTTLARHVLSAGADAVVLDPPELRTEVVAGLTRLAEVFA